MIRNLSVTVSAAPSISDTVRGESFLDLLLTLFNSLANPAILFFLIGLSATLLRVELPIPGGFKSVLTVYLMAAIGFKGGAAISDSGLGQIWLPALSLGLLAAVIPLWVYPVARRIIGFSMANSAALAAHYGSVSAVTYVAAQNQLVSAQIPFEASAPALLAIMEVPGIVTALIIYRRSQLAKEPAAAGSIWHACKEVLRSKSVFVLLASLLAGYLTGKPGMAAVEGFFVTPFQGILTLFLLEMGLEAGKRLSDLRTVGPALVAFALAMPVFNGLIGLMVGDLLGLSTGGTVIVALLAGSASYIAAPTAVRVMVPDASPSLYLTAALGITFPFNLIFGIPLYIYLAQQLAG